MAEIAQVELKINPILDVGTFNAILKNVKGALGDFGGSISFIDPDGIDADMRAVEEALERVEKATKDAFNEKEISGFRKHLGSVKDGLKELIGISNDGDGVKGLFNMEAAERFTGVLENVSEKTSEARSALKTMAAQTGLEGDELERLEGVASRVFQRGGFDSFAESIKAVGTARQFLGDALDDQGLETFVSGAQGIAKVLDTEVNEVLSKSSSFIKTFELDGQRAFELVSLGAQKANVPAQDYMDTLSEYAPLAKEAGLSAEQFMGILVRGGEDATFSIDKIGDALKETQIRANAGDIDKSLGEMAKNIPDQLKQSLGDGLAAVSAGDTSISDFLFKSVKDINAAGLSDEIKNQLFAALSGTPAEDLGADLYSRIFGSEIDTSAITAQASVAGQQIAESIAPTGPIEQLGLILESTLGGVAGFVGPALGPMTQLLQITTQVGPALKVLGFAELAKDAGQFGLKILQSVVPSLVKQVAATGAVAVAEGVQATATGAATTSMLALNVAMLANPVFLIATGVVALAGIFAAFALSGESVEEAMDGVNESLNEVKTTLEQSTAAEKQAAELRALADEYDRLKVKTDPESLKRMAEVQSEIAKRAPETVTGIENIGKAAEEAGGKVHVATDLLRGMADGINAQSEAQKDGAIAQLGKETEDLVEATADAAEKEEELREKKERLIGLLEKEKQAGNGNTLNYKNGFELLQNISIELAEQEKLHKEGNAKIEESVNVMTKAKKSQQEISDQTGLTVEQVAQYQKKTSDAEQAAQATARAAEAVKTETEKAVDAAANLAAQWQQATSATQGALKTANAAGAQLYQMQRSGQQLTAEQTAQLEQIKKQAQDNFKTTKEQAASEKQFQIDTGQIVERTTAKRTKSAKVQKTAFELAQAAFKLDSDKLSLAEREVEIARETDRLTARREETVIDELQAEQAKLTALNLQADALKKALGIAEGADLAAANITIKLDDKKGEPFEAEKMIRDLNADIAEQQNKVTEVKIGALIEVDDGQIRSLKETQLQLRIELGLDEQASFTELIIADIARLESEMNSFADDERQRLSNLFEAKVISEEEYQAEKARLDNGQTQRQLELQNAVFERRKTLRDREYELEQKRIERLQQQERDALQEISDETIAIRERVADAVEEIEGKRVDRDANEAIARLDFRKEQELVTEEFYASEKERIDRESAARRSALQARFLGDRLEAERQAQLASLQLQEQHISEQIGKLIGANKFQEADDMLIQLDDVREQIREKGSLLSGVLGEVQGEFADAAVSLFSFDKEGAKEPFREFFGIMAGALQRLATAKVTEVVLKSISGIGGIPGLILSFAAKPLLEGLMARFLSPILDGLLSFASGARIDGPTLAMIGDGAKLGGTNREWIFHDDTFRDVIRIVVAEANGPVIQELRLLRQEVAQMQFRLHVSGQDLTTSVGRTQAAQRRRVVNQYALAA